MPYYAVRLQTEPLSNTVRHLHTTNSRCICVKSIQRRQIMAIVNKDEIKGKYEQAKGKIKDKVGEATGNRRMEAEGESENAGGKTRESWGKVKRHVSNAIDDVADAVNS